MMRELEYCMQGLRTLLCRVEELKSSSVTSMFENVSVSGPIYHFKIQTRLSMRACSHARMRVYVIIGSCIKGKFQPIIGHESSDGE